MKKIIVVICLCATPATAGGLLGTLIFGSLDATQAECQLETSPRAVAQGHGDMQNGADALFANVQARKMSDASALYYLANALSTGDLEYSATHPQSKGFACHDYGTTNT